MARTISIFVLAFAASLRVASGAAEPLHALLVGGGPDKENNTAQIEEHLKFVAGLVPPSPGRIILFADGKAGSRNLSFTDTSHLSDGLRAIDVLLPNDGLGAKLATRAPDLGAPIDGPSKLPAVERAFRKLAALSGRSGPRILLYFAGHGSQAEDKAKGSLYNLWGDEDLGVATLSREMGALPPRVPVILVMAQCFSGGFADALFSKADANLDPIERPFIGFFAAEGDREAAGCGTETSSPLYQDFSSYFFGALCGRDKLGNKVTGADYDGDGRVSCHEAWCYAMIHDESIDTPVCTSLIFLRRFVQMDDSDIFSTPWKSVIDAATPAERAALAAVSDRLGLSGEDRALAAYDRLMFSSPMGRVEDVHAQREAEDKLNALRMEDLRQLFEKWPSLRWHTSRDYTKAAHLAAADLEQDSARCHEIIDTSERFNRLDEELSHTESMLVRFTDLVEMVCRMKRLREKKEGGEGKLRARFEAMFAREQQGLEGLTPGRQP